MSQLIKQRLENSLEGAAASGRKIATYMLANLHELPFQTSASICLLYTSPSPRDRQKSRMPSSA